MKLKLVLLALAIFTVGHAVAQPHPPRFGGAPGAPGANGGPGPDFGGYILKLFRGTSNFSGTMEITASGGPMGQMTVSGKVAGANGKFRIEKDMTDVKTGQPMPPQVVAQVKQMGMDKIVTIYSEDTQAQITLFPNIKACIVGPVSYEAEDKSAKDAKNNFTKIGEETILGHPCIKNKVLITDKTGKIRECTVWTAQDINNFPLKIVETREQGSYSIIFKDIKTNKPDASLFEPPADFKKYNSMQEMIMSRAELSPPTR